MSACRTLFNETKFSLNHYPRIPYQGSKNAIAKDIINAILNTTQQRGRFVDAFCGGGGVLYSVYLSGEFKEVLGNDINSDLINLHKNLPELDLM